MKYGMAIDMAEAPIVEPWPGSVPGTASLVEHYYALKRYPPPYTRVFDSPRVVIVINPAQKLHSKPHGF